MKPPIRLEYGKPDRHYGRRSFFGGRRVTTLAFFGGMIALYCGLIVGLGLMHRPLYWVEKRRMIFAVVGLVFGVGLMVQQLRRGARADKNEPPPFD